VAAALTFEETMTGLLQSAPRFRPCFVAADSTYHKDTVRVGSLLNSSRGLLKGNLAFSRNSSPPAVR
jgi:hypothetical protein